MPIVLNPKLPDFKRKRDAIRAEIKLALWNSANDVIQDNVQGIEARRGVTAKGSSIGASVTQKENSPLYQAWKSKNLGHTTPLRGKQMRLMDPSLYKITNGPRNSVVAQLPVSRQAIVGYLRIRGYTYWGISHDVAKLMRTRLIAAVRKGKLA